MSAFWTAVLVAVLGGAFALLGHRLAAKNDHERWLRDERFRACVDFLSESDGLRFIPQRSYEATKKDETESKASFQDFLVRCERMLQTLSRLELLVDGEVVEAAGVYSDIVIRSLTDPSVSDAEIKTPAWASPPQRAMCSRPTRGPVAEYPEREA